MSANLRDVASKIFDEDDQFELGELLMEGKIEKAEEFVLFGVDCFYEMSAITFFEAQEMYKLLDLDPDRASRLRQKNVGFHFS